MWAQTPSDGTGRCIVEGRDIGTVVFPFATVKFFLTASAESRARRRVKQEPNASYREILADIVRRDYADTSRAVSPLIPADDAITINTTALSVDDVVDQMSRTCQARGLVTA
jgi:cytidylate kinase